MSTDNSMRRESNSQSNQSAVSSIINVNLDDYFRAINHPFFDNESPSTSLSKEDQTQTKSSTPCRKSDSEMDKYVPTPDDYPFNIIIRFK